MAYVLLCSNVTTWFVSGCVYALNLKDMQQGGCRWYYCLITCRSKYDRLKTMCSTNMILLSSLNDEISIVYDKSTSLWTLSTI